MVADLRSIVVGHNGKLGCDAYMANIELTQANLRHPLEYYFSRNMQHVDHLVTILYCWLTTR